MVDAAFQALSYQLAERLSEHCDNLLLLTATPHHGDDDRFAHFAVGPGFGADGFAGRVSLGAQGLHFIFGTLRGRGEPRSGGRRWWSP